MKKMTKKISVGFLSVAVIASAIPVQGATYNIYFNNAEQGDNSTAKPTVIVQDPNNPNAKPPADAAQPAGTKPASENGPLPATDSDTPVEPEAKSSAPIGEVLARESSDRHWNFRVLVGGVYNNITVQQTASVFTADPSSSTPFWEQTSTHSEKKITAEAEGTWFFHPNFGASLIIGRLTGLEGVVVPFGEPGQHWIQPELTVGAFGLLSGTSSSSNPGSSSNDSSDPSHSAGALAIGAKLAFNLSKNFAAVVGVRSAVTTHDDLNFLQGSAGLAYNF